MTAGVPGLGLSGLFVLLSALALPLARRRKRTRGRVAALFRLGLVMTAAVIASWQIFIHALNLFHHHAMGGRSHHLLGNGPSVGPWPVPVSVISL